MELPTPLTIGDIAAKFIKSGQFCPAYAILTQGLERQPDRGELWLQLATLLHSQGLWQRALEVIETASVLIPLPVDGQLVLADCYSHLGKHELAVVAYEHLLGQGSLPDSCYARLYAGFKRAGRIDSALTACRKALGLTSANDEGWFDRAQISQTRKDSHEG